MARISPQDLEIVLKFLIPFFKVCWNFFQTFVKTVLKDRRLKAEPVRSNQHSCNLHPPAFEACLLNIGLLSDRVGQIYQQRLLIWM